MADSVKKGAVASIISASNESDLNLSVAAVGAKGTTKELAAKKHSVAGGDQVDASINGGSSVQ